MNLPNIDLTYKDIERPETSSSSVAITTDHRPISNLISNNYMHGWSGSTPLYKQDSTKIQNNSTQEQIEEMKFEEKDRLTKSPDVKKPN